jgi:uncharacterized protein YutE (UPF0331/DUF86 family)
MRQPDWTADRAELERVAQEYRARGYQVVVSPSASEVPDFVREYPPDIVARGTQDSVVIEVRHGVSSADRDRLRAIAERVERHPGWRFVVVSAPSGRGLLSDTEFRPIDMEKVRALLREAEGLKSAGHREASLLVCWAALEAAMRLAAQRHAVDLPRPDAWSLMRELVSNGVLDREQYQRLNESFRLRSAVAHGLEPSHAVDLEGTLEIIQETAESLLRDSERPDSETPV